MASFAKKIFGRRRRRRLLDGLRVISGNDIVEEPITSSQFEFLKLTGVGGFSKVFLVQEKETGEYFALKRIRKSKVLDEGIVNRILMEKKILIVFSHPFIVSLHFAYHDPMHTFLGFHFANGGDLFSHLESRGRIPESETRMYVSEILLALEFLHRHLIVYRDLKPENVLLDAAGHALLSDFGHSKVVGRSSRTRSFVGTSAYLAPEMLMSLGNLEGEGDSIQCATAYDGRAVDWWQLGILMYELLFGVHPFDPDGESGLRDLFLNIREVNVQFPPGCEAYVSQNARDLVSGLLEKDPRKRLSKAPQIKSHPFFEDVLWSDVYARAVQPEFVPEIDGPTDLRYFDETVTSVSIDEALQEEIEDGESEDGVLEDQLYHKQSQS